MLSIWLCHFENNQAIIYSVSCSHAPLRQIPFICKQPKINWPDDLKQGSVCEVVCLRVWLCVTAVFDGVSEIPDVPVAGAQQLNRRFSA